MATVQGSSSARKAAQVLQFLQPLLANHFQHCSAATPFFVGINGIQGAGKTTLVRRLASALEAEPHCLQTAVLSIDDLYLPHAAQKKLAEAHPDNPLIQYRGQPGTHDVALGVQLLDSLKAGRTAAMPRYDKSKYEGEGDRLPEDQWEVVNREHGSVKVVVLEGWCVGFRPLEPAKLAAMWTAAAKQRADDPAYSGRLGWNSLESITFVNESLREYDRLTDSLDALVHIDAEDTLWVYDWRLEQETALIKEKSSGMTADQVKRFVDGYYPAYELFYDKLRSGIFQEPGKQLRIIVGKDRIARKVITI